MSTYWHLVCVEHGDIGPVIDFGKGTPTDSRQAEECEPTAIRAFVAEHRDCATGSLRVLPDSES